MTSPDLSVKPNTEIPQKKPDIQLPISQKQIITSRQNSQILSQEGKPSGFTSISKPTYTREFLGRRDMRSLAASRDLLLNGDPEYPTTAIQVKDAPKSFTLNRDIYTKTTPKWSNQFRYKDDKGQVFDFRGDEMIHMDPPKIEANPETNNPVNETNGPNPETMPQENDFKDENGEPLFQGGPRYQMPKNASMDENGKIGWQESPANNLARREAIANQFNIHPGNPIIDKQLMMENEIARNKIGSARKEWAQGLPSDHPNHETPELFQGPTDSIHFNGQKANTFFSPLRRAVEQKMPNAATPEVIRGLLKGAGIKDEELKWSGLEDFMQGKTKITKSDILNHLDENEVKVENIMKGVPLTEDQARQKIKSNRNVFLVNRTGVSNGPPLDEAELNRLLPLKDGDALVEGGTGVKFSEYQIPGGNNYRELLLTLPYKPREFIKAASPLLPEIKKLGIEKPIEEITINDLRNAGASEDLRDRFSQALTHSDYNDASFKSPHFNEPGILSHVRFNDRTTPDGKKVLFLEEVQSDWHQKGRKEGYSIPREDKIKQMKSAGWKIDFENGRYQARKEYSHQRATVSDTEAGAWDNLLSSSDQNVKHGVPDAPFKKTWHELALRRMLRYAAENGYDHLAWTTGEQQAERYDLSKDIDAVYARKRDDGTYSIEVSEHGKAGITGLGGEIPEAKLAEYVGKDLAEKIASQKPSSASTKYEGIDLKVGGHGMKTFYDRMIPQYLDKYGKKWGVKVEPIQIDITDYGARGKDVVAPNSKPGFTENVQSIPITESMRKSVMEEGQPLFQGPKGSFHIKETKAIITLFRNHANITTVMHEGVHKIVNDMIKSNNPLANKLLEASGQKIWNVPAHEWVATRAERYLYDGRAPNKALAPAFAQLKKSFQVAYKNIKGTPLESELKPQDKALFDALFVQNKKIDQKRINSLMNAIKTASTATAARLTTRLQQELNSSKNQ
jgi:hypothetical protein